MRYNKTAIENTIEKIFGAKADNGFIIKRMKGLLFLESYTVYIAKDTEDLINVLKKICSEGDDNGK